ncbi:hypothetical protein LENED_000125 [Lentinula edodes]|uniref:Uncharacterized protein n=1 Tax=Lentinula edodes TaxID=5353 RepID=A0A1Q3DUV9_LENED|nr:hypothetical protein LENED_000125 [Lentinula edodes]
MSRFSLSLYNRILWLLNRVESLVSNIWSVTLGQLIFVKILGIRDATVEVATMKFVRQRTAIPIPRVLTVNSLIINGKRILKITGTPY